MQLPLLAECFGRMSRAALLLVLGALAPFVVDCSGSSSDKTPYCYLDDRATTCPGLATYACAYGGKPDLSRCKPFDTVEQGIYCCTPKGGVQDAGAEIGDAVAD